MSGGSDLSPWKEFVRKLEIFQIVIFFSVVVIAIASLAYLLLHSPS